MTAPLAPGQWRRDYATGFLVRVLAALPDRHPKTGQRLYLTESRTGRQRRLQERNLKSAF